MKEYFILGWLNEFKLRHIQELSNLGQEEFPKLNWINTRSLAKMMLKSFQQDEKIRLNILDNDFTAVLVIKVLTSSR